MTGELGEVDEPAEISDPHAEMEVDIAGHIPAEQYQSLAKQVVSTNFLDILEMMAKKSVEGSLPHAKYLFQIAGVKEDIERFGQEAEPSLADLLIEEVRKQRAAEEERRLLAEKGARVNATTDINRSSAEGGAKPQ